MKNKKIIIILAIVLVVVLIIGTIIMSNGKKKNSLNNTNNVVKENDTNYEDNISEEIERDEDYSVTNKSNSTGNNANENTVIAMPANTRLKQVLLNDTWLKSNIYLKKDCFDNEIKSNVKQKISFIKIEKENYQAPVVVLKVECSEANSSKCYVITFDEGEIKLNSLDDAIDHMSHAEYQVNSSNGIVYKKTQYSEEENYDIYSVSDKEIKKICTISKTSKIEGSEIKDAYFYEGNECTEEKYKNIKDEYINDFIRKDIYKELNSEMVEKNF